jgi:hypothetical protein
MVPSVFLFPVIFADDFLLHYITKFVDIIIYSFTLLFHFSYWIADHRSRRKYRKTGIEDKTGQDKTREDGTRQHETRVTHYRSLS